MAVYTEVADDELRDFVAAYDIGEIAAIKGIAEGVENSNFLLQALPAGVAAPMSYILTLYEKRVRPGDLPFFIGLMEHLAAAGISCPTPVRARDGVALRQLAGKPAAIVTFLSGMWPRRVQPRHCAALGAALAGLHLAGRDFAMHRANDLSVAGWRHLAEATAGRADEVEPGLGRLVASELAALAERWPADLPAGVIHADLFPDNVFFLGDRLSGLIDFYFACNDLFAYDVAICLNAWCFEPDDSFNVTKARLLLSGYRRVRDFTPAEVAALPVLARGAALRFLLTRLYDWLNHPEGAFVRPKNPLEYVRKLRFHSSAGSPAAYGLDWAA